MENGFIIARHVLFLFQPLMFEKGEKSKSLYVNKIFFLF